MAISKAPVYKVWVIAKENVVRTINIDGNEIYPLFPYKENAEFIYNKLSNEFKDAGFSVRELDMVLGTMTRVEEKDSEKKPEKKTKVAKR